MGKRNSPVAMRHGAVEDFPSSFSALIIISFPFGVAVLTPSLGNLGPLVAVLICVGPCLIVFSADGNEEC